MSWKKEQKEMPIATETHGESQTKTTPTQNGFQKNQPISGFSKLTKEQKIAYLVENYIEVGGDELERKQTQESVTKLMKSFWHNDRDLQKTLDEFSENTLTNFKSQSSQYK